jgi:hypothetical protein
MACPHVAGTVALMRQANPNLTADEIKQILMQSALDLGMTGEDNDYGWGMVNALAAVQAAIASSTSGVIQGVVSYGGQYVSGAKITVTGNSAEYSAATNSFGFYRVESLVGNRNYRVKVGRFGFALWTEPDNTFVPEGATLMVNAGMHRGCEDDCEADQAWSPGVTGDDASDGVWVRTAPVASYENGDLVQPGQQHSPSGTRCFITGNAPSPSDPATTADVDGGRTTLQTPVFNLSELIDPVLYFAYYYTNDQGENSGGDFFRVQISSDGGQNWVNLINSSASPRAWQEVSFTVSDFVTPSAQMLIQFIAEDNAPASLVEAAVDDISIVGAPGVPEPPRDLTLDVQFDQVTLKWTSSVGATNYRVYLSGNPDVIVAPENFYSSTPDTTLVVPMSDIPYAEFYFQVTATNQ